jgi:general secretion pathway protein G
MTQSIFPNDTTSRNALAVWALVLGIVGFVLSIVAIGGLLGIVAAVLGIIAVTRPGRKGMAIASIVTGALSLPIALIAAVFWLFVPVALSGRVETARRTATISEISNLKTALAIFETDLGRYPTTAEGLQALLTRPSAAGPNWRGPYLQKPPADMWGHPFVYRFPGTDDPTSYDLFSPGPDGIPGTPDDIKKNTAY